MDIIFVLQTGCLPTVWVVSSPIWHTIAAHKSLPAWSGSTLIKPTITGNLVHLCRGSVYDGFEVMDERHRPN